jgi:hypothetical protein
VKKRPGAKVRPGEVPEAIPAAVVRDLMDGNEQRIDQLREELIEAEREAEEAELRVAVLSGDAGAVAPDRGPPAADADGRPLAPAPDGALPGPDGRPTGPPRTTVVTRPRPPAAG